jgi:dipeptide/tripeptide permease
MGSWFLCNSLGGYFSGFLTSLAKVDEARLADVAYTSGVYFGLYWRCAAALGIVAVVMLGITPFVKRLMAVR